MPNTALKNVVSLRDYDRANPLSPAESLVVLNGCRDRVLDGAIKIFRDRLKGVHDKLFESADRATSMTSRNLYYEALGLLERQTDLLLTEFRSHFVHAVDEALAGRDAPKTAISAELSLLDDSEFEETLTVNKLTSRMRSSCSEQLTALDRRLGVLHKTSELRDDNNPLGPRGLLTAFLDAAEQIGAARSVGIALLQEFDRQVAPAMPGIYQEVNRLLIERGVLPKIALAANAPASAGTSAAAAPGSAETVSAEAGGDLLALIQALVTSRGMAPEVAGPLMAAIGSPGHAPTVRPARPFVQALTELQREGGFPMMLADAAVEGAAAGMTNVLHGLHSSPVMANATPLDSMTLDIVAMLFDLIFEDASVPDHLKAQIGRLQIPLLKVAMLDPAFFSNKKHSARRLLDVLADAAVGWSEEDEPRLYARIGEVIETILDRFEEDIGVFAEQQEAFTAFLADEEARGHANAADITRQLERKEREVLAKVVADDKVAQRLMASSSEPFIRTFLEQLWTAVLVTAYVDHGEQSVEWATALLTVDDLLWSLVPKTGPEERNRLVHLLPDLLRRLRGGLDTIGLDETAKDAVFEKLVFLHAYAVRAGLGAVGPAPKVEMVFPVLTAVAAKAEPVIHGLTVDEGPQQPEIEVDEVLVAAAAPEAMPELDQTESEPPDATAAAEPEPPATEDTGSNLPELPIGTWVKFTSPDGAVRTLRLNWSSRMRGVYLFTNRQGLDALSISRTRLASRIESGDARIFTEENLIERAVGGLMKVLRR